MRIFVTGGSGFVGSHVVRRLAGHGHDVQALARSAGAAEAVAAAGATPVRGALDEPAAWTPALAGTDAVVHAAARMEFWGRDGGFRRDNHLPTLALHAAAAGHGVRRFVLLSAASVSTGSNRAPVVDEATDPGRPNIAYSRVKLATERAVLAAETPGTTSVALRPPFVWGAGMRTLGEMVDAVERGRFAWIDGGRHLMDFVHVENLALAVELALGAGRPGAAYYVTDGTPLPVRDFLTPLLATQGVDAGPARSVPLAVAAPVAATLDRAARLLRRPTPPPLTNWLVGVLGRDRSYDITAARRDLGYRPAVTLAEGLRAMSERAGQPA